MRRITTPLIFLLITALACGPLSGATEEDLSGCGGITLAEESALPGGLLPLVGVPDSFTLADATIMWEANGESYEGIVATLTEDGSYVVVALAHPDGIAGGEFNVTLREGEATCTEATVTIEALEPAPGAVDEYVEAMGAYLAEARDLAGVSRDELLNGDLNDQPTYIVALAALQVLYDAPDNPTAIVNLAQDLDNPELADALVAQTGAAAWMTEQTLQARQRTAGQARTAPHGPININSATDMALAMQEQWDCQSRISGIAGKVRTDIELVSAGVGLISGGTGLVIGGGLLITRLVDEHCAYTYPNRFTDASMEISIVSFEEDYDEEPGRVMEVSATAKSDVWNITGVLKDTLTLLAGGIGEAAGSTSKWVDELGVVTAVTNNICGRYAGCGQNDNLVIPAQTYGPVDDFLSQAWGDLTVQVNPNNAIELGPNFTYTPIEAGGSTLEFELDTEKFGGKSITATADVDVEEIDVTIVPDAATLAPGETATFSVTIEHALYPFDNEWRVLTEDGAEQVVADVTETYTFTAPELEQKECDTNRKVYLLYVESTSNTGPRARSEEARQANATITVEVPPLGECATATPTPSPTPPPLDPCLFGTWSQNMPSFLAYLQSFPSTGGEVVDVTGVSTLTLNDDGTAESFTDMVMTFAIETGDRSTVSIQGGGTTTYFAEDGQLTLLGGVEGQGTFDAFGISGSGTTETGSAMYTCSGNTLTLTVNGNSIIFNKE